MTKRIRDEARGRDCQIRSPVCNGDPATVVGCHLGGGGIGTKRSDLCCVAWGCSDCHDLVDGRRRSIYSKTEIRLWHVEGVIRTLEILEKEGKLKYESS